MPSCENNMTAIFQVQQWLVFPWQCLKNQKYSSVADIAHITSHRVNVEDAYYPDLGHAIDNSCA